MNDIIFALATREIVLKNNDFATTENPDVQNGGILLYGICINPYLPIFGVGLTPDVINGNRKNFIVQLNRWQQQAYQDGATIARWSLLGPVGPKEKLLNEISYE